MSAHTWRPTLWAIYNRNATHYAAATTAVQLSMAHLRLHARGKYLQQPSLAGTELRESTKKPDWKWKREPEMFFNLQIQAVC